MSARLATLIALVATLLYTSSGTGAERSADEGTVRTVLEMLGAEARFASDAAVLPPAGEGALARLIERLERHGELLSIRVVGHSDSRGPADYNLHLSARRAEHVSAAIARRYPAVPLISSGAGESTPRASNATPAGRARNRRVEIHIVARTGGRR